MVAIVNNYNCINQLHRYLFRLTQKIVSLTVLDFSQPILSMLFNRSFFKSYIESESDYPAERKSNSYGKFEILRGLKPRLVHFQLEPYR